MSDVQFVVPAGGFAAGVSTLGNTAGNTGMSGSRLVFSGGDNITLSQATDASGLTVRFDGATTSPLATVSAFWPYDWAGSGAAQVGSTRQFFFPFLLPVALSANTHRIWHSILFTSANNTSTGSGRVLVSAGLYSRSVSSLSLMVSGSSAYTWSNSSNVNLASITGLRAMDVSYSHTSIIPPGNYWFAYAYDIDGNAGVGSLAVSQVVISQGAGTPNGAFFSPTSAAFWPLPGLGRYSVGSASFVNPVAFSEINVDASAHRSQVFNVLSGFNYGPT